MKRRAWRCMGVTTGTIATEWLSVCGDSAAGAVGTFGSTNSAACAAPLWQQAWVAGIACTATAVG